MGVFLVHFGLSCFLCGLIWVIQAVHYPLFAKIPSEAFAHYEADHQKRISFVVVPAMVLELASAIALVLNPPPSLPINLLVINIILLALIWISTFALQVPLHRNLSRGYDARAIDRLVRTNWIRTLGWTLKTLLLITIFWRNAV